MPCSCTKRVTLTSKQQYLGDFHHPAFPPPTDGVESLRNLAHAERSVRQFLQLETMTSGSLDMVEQVQSGQVMRQVKNCVSHEHFVVETQNIVANNEVGFPQSSNEFVGPPFGVDLVGFSAVL